MIQGEFGAYQKNWGNIPAGSRKGSGRYLPLQDDISSVAYWYQDKPVSSGSVLGNRDDLEII